VIEPKWISAPIASPYAKADDRYMSQVAVRCHPFAPVASEELRGRLTAEVDRLRGDAPEAAIRLLRLSQPGSEGEIEVGWQIELSVVPPGSPLDDRTLRRLLRNLRLLGLQPSVLRAGSLRTTAPEFAECDAAVA
jgi:hypothetical protein